MLQNSARNVPYEASSSSSATNQYQQPRLFNRMSDFLFQKRQGSLLRGEHSEPTLAAHSGRMTSPIGGAGNGDGTSTNHSALDEDNGSRVDSMFSITPSNNSNTVNTTAPPPGRTVRLDGGAIHRPTDALPSPPHHRLPSQPTINDNDNDNDNTATISYSETAQPSAASTVDDLLSPVGSFDQAFEKMAQEYGLPENVAKTLPLEAKQVLLRNSQAHSRKQHTNSNGFFSWRTWGIPKKQKHHADVRHNPFLNPSTSSQPFFSSTTEITNPVFGKKTNKRGHNGNSINNTRKKAHSTSARGRSQHASITNFNQDPGNHSDSARNTTHRYNRSSLKKALSPEYFVHLLKDTHVRDLDESQVQDLRVCLRSVKASWTTQFLQLGGYNILSNLFRQMNLASKRSPNDDKILQHLAKCFKAIMTHEQAGVAIVLTNPVGLEYIRDLLFGQVDPKQRALYSLSVITRAHFLNILCTLANLQVAQSDTTPYIHGYDILRRLLLDRSSLAATATTTALNDDDDSNTASRNGTDNLHETIPSPSDDTTGNDSTFPFRMTLKEDPQTIMKVILENDPFHCRGQPWKPRYTAWMRELQYTVEKEIEPITFLAQVLDYKFESAFRQLRITAPIQQHSQNPTMSSEQPALETIDVQKDTQEEGSGSVMVDDGVVEYLIAHLRLINTVVSTQPTFHTVPYDDYGREKVRMEVMMSGFDKIAKALQSCPHPTLYAFYFRYLQPLLQPLADITPGSEHKKDSIPLGSQNYLSTASSRALPSNDGMLRWEDEIRQSDGSGIVFEKPPWEDDDFYDDDSDEYEDYDSDNEDHVDICNYDDTYYDDDDDDDDDDDMAISSVQGLDHRWRANSALPR